MSVVQPGQKVATFNGSSESCLQQESWTSAASDAVCKASTWEVEAEGLEVQYCPGLCSETLAQRERGENSDIPPASRLRFRSPDSLVLYTGIMENNAQIQNSVSFQVFFY